MKFSDQFSFTCSTVRAVPITGCTDMRILGTGSLGFGSLLNASLDLDENYLGNSTTMNSDNEVKRREPGTKLDWYHSGRQVKRPLFGIHNEPQNLGRKRSQDHEQQQLFTIRKLTKKHLSNELSQKRKQKFTFQHERLRALESVPQRQR